MTKGHVLLVNPWIHDFAAYDLWAGPLGLLSIGAVLQENGYQVRLLDCLDRWHPALLARQGRSEPKGTAYGTGKWPKEVLPTPHVLAHVRRRYGRYGVPKDRILADLARLPRPAAVLVTSGMTYWYPGVVEAIQAVRTRFPGVPIALGGIYATLCPDHAARAGADAVLPGEGEVAALRWVDGVTGRASDYDRYRTLDDLPSPAHDLRVGPRAIGVLTARGCPYSCSYCATRLLNAGFRQRDPLRVVGEIDHWVSRGTTDIAFFDDALLVNTGRHLHVILDEVIGRGLRVRFHTPNGLHAELLDETLARQMRRAGFETIRLGLDTAPSRQAQQRAPAGKVTPAGFERAVAALWAAGFTVDQVGAYVLVGRPDQTADEVRESVEYAHRLGVPVRLAFYSPIPGTPDYDQAVAVGALPSDADPLLHNNTAWPLAGWWMTAQEMQGIKEQALAGNERLKKRVSDPGRTP